MKEEKETQVLEFNHQPNSIEVTRNAKGDYTWKIKKYYGSIFVAAINEIQVVDKMLKKHFIKENGN